MFQCKRNPHIIPPKCPINHRVEFMRSVVRSSFNKKIRTLNDINSTCEPPNSSNIQLPKSTYSSHVISLFGMGVVRDNSQTSLDDMGMFSSFRPSEETGAGAQAPKCRYSSSSIWHGNRPRAPLSGFDGVSLDLWKCRFRPRLRSADSWDGAAIAIVVRRYIVLALLVGFQ